MYCRAKECVEDIIYMKDQSSLCAMNESGSPFYQFLSPTSVKLIKGILFNGASCMTQIKQLRQSSASVVGFQAARDGWHGWLVARGLDTVYRDDALMYARFYYFLCSCGE